MICIFYGILLLWMLEVGTVKYHVYFDSRHPLPVKLMYWGNVLFPALTLLWAIAGAVLHRKIGFSRYLCGLLAGAVLTAIPIFSIAELEKVRVTQMIVIVFVLVASLEESCPNRNKLVL